MCLPGTIAATARSTNCSQCPATTYQPSRGASHCLSCGDGWYCPTGSSVRIPASCLPGTFLPSGVTFFSDADCETCPVTKYCSGGNTGAKLCSSGSFANVTGLAECYECAAGRYQQAAGSTACETCPLGGYCEANTAVPTRCAAGSFGNESGLTSQEGCHDCPAGSACSLGATAPTPCAAGSVSNLTNAETCTACAAGTFQGDRAQQRASFAPGGYWPRGAVAPTL